MRRAIGLEKNEKKERRKEGTKKKKKRTAHCWAPYVQDVFLILGPNRQVWSSEKLTVAVIVRTSKEGATFWGKWRAGHGKWKIWKEAFFGGWVGNWSRDAIWFFFVFGFRILLEFRVSCFLCWIRYCGYRGLSTEDATMSSLPQQPSSEQ